MTTSETAFVKYIEKTIVKYTPLIGLSSYNIEVHRSAHCNSKTPKAGFLINVMYPYKSATLYWTDRAFLVYKEKELKKIDQAIVHELCHIPVERLRRLAEKRYFTKNYVHDATEHLVDHFAWVIYRLTCKKSK